MDAGKHFVAVTDPGSKMQTVAESDKFGDVFFGDKTIGGRYSVLSNFGMVPAAAMGLDLKAFAEATAVDGAVVRRRGRRQRPIQGAKLGFILGEACEGRGATR